MEYCGRIRSNANVINRAERRARHRNTAKVNAYCIMKALSTTILLHNVVTSISVHAFQTPSSLHTKSHSNSPRYVNLKSRWEAGRSTLSIFDDRRILGGLFGDYYSSQPIQLCGNQRSMSRKMSTELFMKDSSPATDSNPSGSIPTDSSENLEEYSLAIRRTLICMVATAIFGLGIYSMAGFETSTEFFAGYLVEQSLSIDNLFVFLLLFDYFKIPVNYQDRVLSYGIYGAVVMRAVMIGLGAVALERFHAILLVFAAILVYSSATVLIELVTGGDEGEKDEDMSENAIVRFSRTLFDTTDQFDGDRFFVIEEGMRKATPLFLCLVAVEISDVVFAVDSIPAVFGITENPLIVFSSNMFAIIGLRSLYTILSKAAKDLDYLEPAVAVVLGFIGSKMVAEYFGHPISTELSLAVVATCLSAGVGLSVWEKDKAPNLES